ncbi:MAG TPA: hypothetical protein VLV28_01540 [Gaiellaceae bacterium]|nr:hypothetical protein [Gaiellaceae bacterium]
MAIRQRLLETPPERVPAELAKTVAAFCGPLDVIATAWVGVIEITRGVEQPEEHLGVAFELAEPVAETDEGDRELRLVADRFYETMPEEIQEGGCNFLEPGGITAWADKAQRVFSR